MQRKVIVIGGGAAGLMAAGRAAELAAPVLLLEKTPRLGNKLRLTSQGRCNLTNACDLTTFLAHLGPNANFMRNALARFFVADLLAFFDAQGVPTVTERGQRVFPSSQRAEDVVAALQRYNLRHGVEIRPRSPVAEILAADGAVQGVRLANGVVIEAAQVVLATGGLSYPRTGSSGDGYEMARRLGHTITPLRPGLVPLETAEEFVPRLQGLSLRNVRATARQNGQVLGSAFGEMLFTHFGVSGPIILTLSSLLSEALERGPVQLSLDLKPALSPEQLDQRLQRDLAALGKASFSTLLIGLVPQAMIPILAERSQIPRDERLGQITAEQRRRLGRLLKDFSLTILRTRPIAEAIITLGGVAMPEIVPQTMASRLVRELYFAGEIIDIAGDTGGYNLQVAFTTGRVAGEAAAQALHLLSAH